MAFIGQVATRIINEAKGVNRVVYGEASRWARLSGSSSPFARIHMGEFRIEIASEMPCLSCGAAVPLDKASCPSCAKQAPYRIPFDKFFGEVEGMCIADARYGGLVIGRTSPEDDIPMYQYVGSGIFEVVGLMQGGEFIVSRAATEKHRDLLEKINSEKSSPSTDITLTYSPLVSVINTNLLPKWGGLWISSGQFIIKGFATAKHLTKLEQLNADANAEGKIES